MTKKSKYLGIKKFYNFFKKDRYILILDILGFIFFGIMDTIPVLFLVAIVDILSGVNANILGFIIPKDYNIVYLFIMMISLWAFIDISIQQIRSNVRIRTKKYIQKLRKEVHSNIISPTNEITSKFSQGDTSFRISNDIYAVEKIYTYPLTEIISPLMTGAFSIIYLFFIDYKISLLSLISIPIFIYLSHKIITIDYQATSKIKKSQSKSNNYIINMLSNFKMINLSKGNEKEKQHYDVINKEISNDEIKLAKKYRFFWLLINILKLTVTMSSIILATISILNNQYSAATLLIVFNYVKNTYKPIYNISRVLSNAISGSVEMERVFELIKDNDFIEGELIDNIESIEFRNTFVGTNEKTILANVNMSFYKDKLNYIVGGSGIGKSILMSCLYSKSFFKNGELLINNQKIEKINFDKISVCFQDSIVLNRSVKENILYPDEIDIDYNLLNTLNISEKLLNKDPNELLDANVQTLSGGEKRKINLYRCLSKKREIYILDEPTNDLDKDSINKLKNYLIKKKGSAIFIIITHNNNFIIPEENIIYL